MTPHKTIAGYNLDEVFEKEEARLKAEREAAEVKRRRQELEQKRAGRKPRPATTTPPTTPPFIIPAGSLVVPYHGIEFEHPAYRKAGKTDKTLLAYDASLARLRAAGFERHPRPQEVFGLLIDGLEGKLTKQEKSIHDDLLTSYGEWLSVAFERQGNRLITYLDPEGLEWRNDKYVKTKSFKYSDTKNFDISGQASEQLIDLKFFQDDFVTLMYTRSFNQLPEQLQKGKKRAQVYLPPDGQMWPVGRGVFNDWCSIDCRNYVRAFRGVHEI